MGRWLLDTEQALSDMARAVIIMIQLAGVCTAQASLNPTGTANPKL